MATLRHKTLQEIEITSRIAKTERQTGESKNWPDVKSSLKNLIVATLTPDWNAAEAQRITIGAFIKVLSLSDEALISQTRSLLALLMI